MTRSDTKKGGATRVTSYITERGTRRVSLAACMYSLGNDSHAASVNERKRERSEGARASLRQRVCFRARMLSLCMRLCQCESARVSVSPAGLAIGVGVGAGVGRWNMSRGLAIPKGQWEL